MLTAKWLLFPCVFITLPYFVTPDENFVYEYDPESFKKQIAEMDGNFVMFYAPWCRHCTDFYPIWSELAREVNNKHSKYAIAQVDCTIYAKLCHENDITGYPTLLYFHKSSFTPVEYKGTRDLPSITLFLTELFEVKQKTKENKETSEVKTYGGVAYLNDQNIDKFLSKGQHFVLFYASWCKACQILAPMWAQLGTHFASNPYINIGKVNCMENEMTCKTFDIKQYPYLMWIDNGRIVGVANYLKTFDALKAYVEKMMLNENHDPEKFMKKEKALPVARICEDTFETFLEKELVFVNYFAPWCAHCMQLSPIWLQLGEKFQNESRVLIADVDCVRSTTVCEIERVLSLPTLVLYKNKKVVSMEHGSQPLDTLVALVSTHLDKLGGAKKDEQHNIKEEL